MPHSASFHSPSPRLSFSLTVSHLSPRRLSDAGPTSRKAGRLIISCTVCSGLSSCPVLCHRHSQLSSCSTSSPWTSLVTRPWASQPRPSLTSPSPRPWPPIWMISQLFRSQASPKNQVNPCPRDQINPSCPQPSPRSPSPLTRKNLALLNTLNGDSKRKKHSNYFESDTVTISTTTSGFAEKAYKNSILDPPDSTEPTDLDTLRHRLTQRRNSIQPPLPAHQRYCEFISSSANEAKVSALVQKRIMIDDEDLSLQHRRAINQTITPDSAARLIGSSTRPTRGALHKRPPL